MSLIRLAVQPSFNVQELLERMQARPPTDIADQPSGVIREKFKERGELEVEHRSGWFCLLTASKLSKVRIRCIFFETKALHQRVSWK